MKNILVPIDFSISAKYAAEFAQSLAQLIEGKITFLHVIQLIPDTAIATALPESTFEEVQREMENFKQTIQWTSTNDTRIMYGEVNSVIIDTAKELKADYIVMGNIGHSKIFETVFGSHTLTIAKRAKCPVWVIPGKTELDKIKSVIYASDLQGDEVEVVNKLISISNLIGANLKAVHIEEEFEPEIFTPKEIIAGIKRHLTDQSIVFKNLHREDTIKGIDAYIKSQKPDVIVLAQEKKGFLEKLFHISTTRHFILSAKIPVLVLQKNMEVVE